VSANTTRRGALLCSTLALLLLHLLEHAPIRCWAEGPQQKDDSNTQAVAQQSSRMLCDWRPSQLRHLQPNHTLRSCDSICLASALTDYDAPCKNCTELTLLLVARRRLLERAEHNSKLPCRRREAFVSKVAADRRLLAPHVFPSANVLRGSRLSRCSPRVSATGMRPSTRAWSAASGRRRSALNDPSQSDPQTPRLQHGSKRPSIVVVSATASIPLFGNKDKVIARHTTSAISRGHVDHPSTIRGRHVTVHLPCLLCSMLSKTHSTT